MAVLLGFKLIVLFIMTCVLFSTIRNREKILDLNEEIVRRNELISGTKSNVTGQEQSRYKAGEAFNKYKFDAQDQMQDEGEDIEEDEDDDGEIEFYEEGNCGGLITLINK